MQKLIYYTGIFCLLLSPAWVNAQAPTISHAEAEANEQKTGNTQDLLTSYLQIAAKNLTSDNKGVNLKLNWFALNTMDSVHKYDNANYLHTGWQRNGQFVLGGGMDKNGKFNSVQGGLSYNLLNRRDSTLFHYFDYYKQYLLIIARIEQKEIKPLAKKLSLPLEARLNQIIKSQIQLKTKDQLKAGIYQEIKSFPEHATIDALIATTQTSINTTITNSSPVPPPGLAKNLADFAAALMVTSALNKYTTSFGKQTLTFDIYLDAATLKQMTDAIDQDIKADPLLQSVYQATGLTDVDQKIMKQYRNLVDYVSRQPIVTFNYNYTYGQDDLTSSHDAGLQGMWGLNKIGSRKTNQLTWGISDTLTARNNDKIKSFNRNILDFQAGLNTVIILNKNKSLLEFNIGVEDHLLTAGNLDGEGDNKFMLNSYLRARLPNSPWLKLNIKADTKGNILGLLDFTYNIDSSK